MRRRIVLGIALTLGVLGIVMLPSVAGLTPDPGQTSTSMADRSVTQNSVDCSACHDEPAKVNFPNSDVCAGCHVNIGMAYQRSVHSEKTNTHANFACMECHEEPEDSWFMHFQAGPHGAQRPGVTNAPEETCAQSMCHDDQNPYGPVYAEWEETGDGDWSEDMYSHSKPAPSATRTEECSACHGTHEGSLANIERATSVDAFANERQPDPDTIEEWRITCSACHDPHDVRENDVLRGDFEREGQLCAQCHTGDIGTQLEGEASAGIHQSIWQLYSESTFAHADGRHPELACSSCHMAAQPRTDEYNAVTGHSFDVNTTLLTDTDRSLAPPDDPCGSCHTDLDATISTTTGQLAADLALARSMEDAATQTLSDRGLSDDDQLVSDLQAGSDWLDFVGTPTAGLHNPDLARDRIRDAIERFDAVKSQAYQQESNGSNGATTTTTTDATTTTQSPTTGTTETATPGFGFVAVIGVLLTFAVFVTRRES